MALTVEMLNTHDLLRVDRERGVRGYISGSALGVVTV